ncbi:hypothetical protein BD779DRAFT_1541567 [Infundibulicybe gibba]|nr:hypothetical protein BD779DRAFT_1541567 [Infundibulicybe gibba]
MIFAPIFVFIFAIASPNLVASRKLRDTGGTIALEEAWTIPALLDQITPAAAGGAPLGLSFEQLIADLLDIHNQRLSDMNANGVDFQMAVDVNNQLAASISNSTDRFGGFASALVNDYQQSGADNSEMYHYFCHTALLRPTEYDVFWQMVTDLDVPVYFHPRPNIAQISQLLFTHAPFLQGPSQEFAATLSTHILGLCTNGVFDRFPKLKIIVGHLGERIPSDLFRIDDQLQRQVPEGLPMLRNASSYWRTNLFETTSGNFATPFSSSISTKLVSMSEGATWVDSLDGSMDRGDTDSIRRGVAMDLLKLNQ